MQQQALRDFDQVRNFFTGTPDGVKSYRVTQDRAGRWHIAFAAIPATISAPGTGQTVGVDRGVVVSAALSSGELLHVPTLTRGEQRRLRRLRRRLARARRGSRRGAKLKATIARVTVRGKGRRKDWVEKINAAYTSRICSACGHVASDSRENQATFRCVACGFRCHADVNAARNIAAGRAVTARGAFQPLDGATNREPQLDTSLHQ